jgi:hypothetical protein
VYPLKGLTNLDPRRSHNTLPLRELYSPNLVEGEIRELRVQGVSEGRLEGVFFVGWSNVLVASAM